MPMYLLALVAALAASPSPPDSGDLRMPRRPPAELGMAEERLAVIDRVMARAIQAGGFPGAAVIVGRRGAIAWERGYGTLDWRSGTPVVAERTMYDLASLTKAVATSAAAMILVDRGRLRLDDPVGRYLREFRAGDRSRVTVRDLLAHRSGLPVGRDLPRGAPAIARRAVLETPLESEPGTRTAYSDIGPDVLAILIERVTGEPLDRFVRRTIYARLGMTSTMFRPRPADRARIAPTEVTPPRGYPLRGEVHDENAFALGGVAGHAGLFSTAADLSVFAQMMLNGGEYGGVRVASDSAVELFTRRAAGARALGWDTCSGGGSCGHRLSRRAYGHTGYTGTSMWIDPERELFVIVLTNWVHARPERTVAPLAILHDVRSDVADLAALAIIDGEQVDAMPDRMRCDNQYGWWR